MVRTSSNLGGDAADLILGYLGPAGSGKTALAATMALGSDYPFIKLISPESMVGYSESGKINELNKIFSDSYKSPISVIVIDSIERILGKCSRSVFLERIALNRMHVRQTGTQSARDSPMVHCRLWSSFWASDLLR
jgi:SpoVK/Ycf46/Vps4 family AAA+-type ATPase